MFKSRLKPLALIALLLPLSAIGAVDSIPDSNTQNSQVAPDGFIKDDLFVYIHAGSSKKFKILGSIKAGTALQLLDSNEETGFIQIKEQSGRIGWIEKSSYTTEPGYVIKLQRLQQQYDQLNLSIDSNETTIEELAIKLQAAESTNEEFTQQVAILNKEKDQLQAEIAQSRGKAQWNQWVYGASIVLAGIFVGLVLPLMFKRRRRNEFL